MNLYAYAWLVTLYLVSVTVFLILRVYKKWQQSLLAKACSSLLFVVIGLLSLLSSTYLSTKIFVIIGLIFGLLGDVFLDLKVMYPKDGKSYLNTGMFSFGAGHIMYFVGIQYFTADKILTGYGWVLLAAFIFSLLVGAMIVRFASTLKMDFSGFKVQNWLYSSILIFMTISSVCLAIVLPIAWVLAAGFILFLASDLILSSQYFGEKQDNPVLTVYNHILYYLAQVLIASFIFFI